MNELLIRGRAQLPLTTGIPAVPVGLPAQETQEQSFQEILEKAVSDGAGISFSKHAVGRVAERGIQLSQSGLERLADGVKAAQEKGLSDALILMDGSAFIVSAKSGTVITAMPSGELKGRVFTNIDGTVIL